MLYSHKLYSFLLNNYKYSFINNTRILYIKSSIHKNVSFYSVRTNPELGKYGSTANIPLDNQDILKVYDSNEENTTDSFIKSKESPPNYKGSISSRKDLKNEVEESFIDAEINELGSPFSAMCWHKGPYSNHFKETSKNNENNTGSESQYQSYEGTDGVEIKELSQTSDVMNEMENLLSIERKEKERIRLLMERDKPLKIDEHIRDKQLSSKVSTLKLLSISSQIAKRRPSSIKPQVDMSKYLKEKRYQKLLLKDTEKADQDKNNKKNRCRKENSIETIRVLDIDRLPLSILHHMLCYTLVKNVPAENVLKIISNIASLRDKNKHICYQNLFKLAVSNSSPLCAPEIVATLTRCYQSISIPFMVDYVRKYGTFSRKFLSNMINRYSQPFPLDFLRYESHSRSLPMILTRPWSLLSYVNLMKNSSAKRYMYLNLLNYGYVPNTKKFDNIHAYGTMDYELSGEILSFEKLLDENILISDNKEDPNRPKIYDKILELQHSGDYNLEDFELTTETNEPTPTSLQFIKILNTGSQSSSEYESHQQSYKDIDNSLNDDGSHISWSVPWGVKRDVFHYRGKTYKLDRINGWLKAKSNVKINYLKNVKMNKRKRDRRLIRRRANKEAKLRVLSTL